MNQACPNTTFDMNAAEARLHAMTEMVDQVAHNCMNTLMPITAYTELLLRRPQDIADTQKVTHYLAQMQLAAEQTVKSIRALRQMRARVELQDGNAIPGRASDTEVSFQVPVTLKHSPVSQENN